MAHHFDNETGSLPPTCMALSHEQDYPTNPFSVVTVYQRQFVALHALITASAIISLLRHHLQQMYALNSFFYLSTCY